MEQKTNSKCIRFVVDAYPDESHVKVTAECGFHVSDKCRIEYTGEYRYINKNSIKNSIRNDGKYICLYCSRFLKNSGCKNPNARYNIDDSMLEKVDTDFKAYFLGMVASDGHVRKGETIIELNNRDIEILEKLRDGICEDLTSLWTDMDNNMVSLTILSTQISKDINNHLGIEYGKKRFKNFHPRIRRLFKMVFYTRIFRWEWMCDD